MALHKLLVDDFYDDTYILIAVHCRLEDYRLAYLLNQKLHINLKRSDKDLDLNYTTSSYAIYEWKDDQAFITWNLVSNICKKEEESLYSTGVLFIENNSIIKTYNLIPEFKQVDYFIKISNEIQHINERVILSKLQAIPNIITSYSVDLSKIKSKEHLIF